MKLIIGLGNNGPGYEQTRHNVGFMAVDWLADRWESDRWHKSSRLKAETYKDLDHNVVLAKPLTQMNLSGQAVAKLLRFYKLKLGDLIVIHDDADLPIGAIRVAESTQSGAGHHGVLSALEQTGPGFRRLRLGIGRPDQPVRDISNYVLTRLTAQEKKTILAAFSKKLTDGLDL